MGLDATICIGTFGSREWVDLAKERAVPSAKAQGVPIFHCHGATLAEARNAALEQVTTPWVVFLDADDELASGYLAALDEGTADLRGPAISYVKLGRMRSPYVPKVAGHTHDCSAECLRDGNWLVIGTAVRTEMVREVGGFREFEVYEDWDLFLRCWLAGGTVEAVPTAVYLAHWRRQSRNRAPGVAAKNQVHRDIIDANFGVQVAA